MCQLKPTIFNLAAIAIALLLTPVARASVPRAGEATPLKPLAEWLLRTGKPSVVRSRILEAMNLPALDMPVRERGFRHEGERITHVCSICTASGYSDLIFFAQVDESNGSATVWRTGPEGCSSALSDFRAASPSVSPTSSSPRALLKRSSLSRPKCECNKAPPLAHHHDVIPVILIRHQRIPKWLQI